MVRLRSITADADGKLVVTGYKIEKQSPSRKKWLCIRTITIKDGDNIQSIVKQLTEYVRSVNNRG